MMKKFMAIVALAAVVLGPNAALAQSTVTTTLQKDGTLGSGSAPVVIAKWEMDGPTASLTGTDAQVAAGSQIMPSGQYGVNKTVSICGIVSDPNGKADIASAHGDVYYPNNVSLGSSHIDPVTGLHREVGTCGEMVRECTMTALDPAAAFNLFCNNVRNNNSNLPTFAANYNYANICDDAQSGVLAKQTAYVECCDFVMSYEDPNGPYTVNVWATDKSDLDSTPLSNTMTYLESKAFEVDFTGINYGLVKTGSWQEIPGNTTWASPSTVNGATIRNASSTRLQLGVWQNDMGIKDPDGTTYVTYKAAVGSPVNYITYGPNLLTAGGAHQPTWLQDTLDLSEMNEVDFGVLVSKFPIQLTGPFVGTMELSAQSAGQLPCPL